MYTDDYGTLAAAVAAFAAMMFFFALIGYAITSFFMMKLFEKAGVQGKWRAWVPIYNTMVFAKLGDVNPWAMLIVWGGTVVGSLIPYLGPIISFVGAIALAALGIMAALRIQAKLGKDAVWIVLFILVGIVWLGILAFDKSRWNLAVGVPQWSQQSFLVDSTTWEGIPPQNATAAPAPQWPAGGQYPPAQPAAGTPYPPAPPAGGQEYPPVPPADGPQTPPAPPAPGPDTPDRGQSPQA